MSTVQEQIDRIRGNVAAALAALTNKGVTVPSGANSDNLASLIAGISAGGGLTKQATGSFAAPSGGAQSSFSITGLAFRPVAVYFYLNGGSIIHFGIATELYAHYKRSSTTYTPSVTFTDDGATVSGTNIRPTGAPLAWVAFG